MAKTKQNATILGKTGLSDRVMIFHIGLEEGFSYNAGQYIKVYTDAGKADYSIISKDFKEDEMDIMVDNHEKSTVGKFLHGQDVGSRFEVKGPYGHFDLEGDDENLVLAGYNIGMAPILSHLYDLKHKKFSGKIECINLRTDEFEDVFSPLVSEFSDNLDINYQVVDSSVIKSKRLVKGKLKKKELKEMGIPNDGGNGYYIAGKSKAIKKFRKSLEKYGVSREKIHLEKF